MMHVNCKLLGVGGKIDSVKWSTTGFQTFWRYSNTGFQTFLPYSLNAE